MACVNCFDDAFLKKNIDQIGSPGNCNYCDSEGVSCVDGWDLREMFQQLLEQYEPLEMGFHYVPGDDPWDYGEPLGDLIDEDWRIFSENLPPESRNALLDSIFNSELSPKEQDISGIEVCDLWARKEENFHHVDSTHLWNNFASHIKKERRFIFNTQNQDLQNAPPS